MINRIKALEDSSSSLEPSREALLNSLNAYTDKHLEDIYSTKTYQSETPDGSSFHKFPISEQGYSIDNLLALFEKEVRNSGINASAHGHLGYIPGGGLYASALGDFLAAIVNNYAGVFFASPGAVRMENHLISWMADMVGYPPSAAGNLASGGSIANLAAIVAARDAHGINSSNLKQQVIYCSSQMHHCLLKAIRIAGLHEAIMRIIPQNNDHSLNATLLADQIKQDEAEGLKPWLVIASAGTTDVGAIDPLEEMGRIAKQAGCWYHIDAAYGGFFMLVESIKNKFNGLSLSDSIVLDPHKGLFLPFGTGALLVKNKKHLLDSHYYLANYMQDTQVENAELSPADLSPELSKHFRGLRMWLPLMLHGLQPFRAALEEKLLLAQYCYEKLGKLKGIELGPAPSLSIFYWRYMPDNGEPNSFNKQLLQRILADGRVFMSSTTIDDKFLIRIAVLSFRTHLKTIDLAIDIIKHNIEALEAS